MAVPENQAAEARSPQSHDLELKDDGKKKRWFVECCTCTDTCRV